MTPDAKRFTGLQRLLHWSMAVCIIAMFFIGVGMVSTIMPKYVPLLATHKTLGVAIFVLALIRLAVRARSGTPPLPADLPAPMRLAAHLSHYGLYGLMVAMPLLGWAMLSAGAYPVVLYGGLRLPAIVPQNPTLHTVLLERAFLPGLRVLRPRADPCRGGAVPRAGAPGRRVRGDGPVGSRTGASAGKPAPGGRDAALAQHALRQARWMPRTSAPFFRVRSIGWGVPETQILSSASRSKVPAVSTEKRTTAR